MKPAIAVVFVSLFLPPLVRAQTTPDFSGTWTMDAARSASAVQNEPVRSKSLVIQQTPTKVTIERTTDGKTFTTTYTEGAADARSAASPGGRWYWDGPRLVIESGGNVSGSTVRTKEVLSLGATGAELTVETLLIVEHGYTLSGAKNYASGKDVYKRSPR
jgi:hypothetical protein